MNQKNIADWKLISKYKQFNITVFYCWLKFLAMHILKLILLKNLVGNVKLDVSLVTL